MKTTKILVTSTLALALTSSACMAAGYHVSRVHTLQSTIAQKDKLLIDTKKELSLNNKVIKDQKKKIQDEQKQAEEEKKQIDELKKKLAKSQMPTLVSRGDMLIPPPMHEANNNDGFTEGWTLTYYSADAQSTGKNPGDAGYGVTASGRVAESGVTIAVDPNVIPLGSTVEVMYPDGEVIRKRADDTGGAIRGKHIDVYLQMSEQALMEKGIVSGAKVRVLPPK